VLKILSDAELKKEAKVAERRRAIRAVAAEIFDFGEISRRTLAAHWQARAPAERQEFVALFGDLLENAYISKIEGYTGEKIVYTGEALDGGLAVVKTRIVTKQGTEIPVDYRMLQQGERWRITEFVRLDNLVELKEETTASRIDRLDRQRQVSIRAGVGPGYALADRLEALQAAAREMDMPAAYSVSVRGRECLRGMTGCGMTYAVLGCIVLTGEVFLSP